MACFQPPESGARCALTDACRLQSLLGEALAAFLAVLDGRTLADLLAPAHGGATAARLGLALPVAWLAPWPVLRPVAGPIPGPPDRAAAADA